ncbi:MAG: pyridoxal-phosphate dependent enzyme [Steroidobacteraceae bacterium]
MSPTPVQRNVLEMIGHTPLVAVQGFDTGPCELYLKLESQNPSGSIKDRVGLYMIEAAERAGRLEPGATLVEATAGNTGLGLALAARRKGYPLRLVIPDKMSREKIFHLKAMGAEVVMTRSDVPQGHPDYYQDRAARIARETPHAFYVNQFANESNPEAHERTTAPEIWEQMEHRLDAVVCGVGTGGTLTGLSRFFARTAPGVEIVLADPQGSALAGHVRAGHAGSAGQAGRAGRGWLVEGIGGDHVPPVCDLSRVRHAVSVSDAESFNTCRELLLREGILGGTSTGTLLAAALRYCRGQRTARRVVSLVCDSGNKYLSKVYNDFWMLDQGFLTRERFGDLRDLIARRHAEGADVTVAANETLLAAYGRMKLYDVSQLPVMRGGRIAGIVDEEDVLLEVFEHPERFDEPVSRVMASSLVTVAPDASLSQLLEVFKRGLVAIVMHRGELLGLITRIDVLNWLRRRM